MNFHNYLHGVLSSGSTRVLDISFPNSTINYTYSESADSTHHITNLHWLHLVSFFLKENLLSRSFISAAIFSLYISNYSGPPKPTVKSFKKGNRLPRSPETNSKTLQKFNSPWRLYACSAIYMILDLLVVWLTGSEALQKDMVPLQLPITGRFGADDHASFWIC